jgi:amidase
MNPIVYWNATDLAKAIQSKDVSCREVMGAFLDRIDAVDGQVNAICTLERELAIEGAQAADDQLAAGNAPGRLHGLPIAIKDLVETKGIKTTFGSPLFKDFVPQEDQLFVSRLKQAGAIVIGKTNTPEFGAGSHSFNPVHGVTRNPYDLSKAAGGSSGGAAAALATGMLPIADGSDLGGSLRNPASFCNVVGFRPSPGRVPRHPNLKPGDRLSVLGPMGRNVTDTALLLSVMAGPDERDPISLREPGEQFLASLARDFKGARIAWSPDMGHLAVTSDVKHVLGEALSVFQDLGCTVDAAHPELANAEEIFLTLRSAMFAERFAPYVDRLDELVKDTIAWNVRQGLGRSEEEVAKTETDRLKLREVMDRFFETHDFLLLPAAQLPPFPAEWDWVHEIEGVKYDNYLQWMQACCVITLTECPAISVPGGFTAEGLPVGLQIVGPRGKDLEVLQIAYAFEQATKYGERHPDLG